MAVSTFQRARNEEQREIRRRAILETAAAMMGEMPVAAVSLNELSRRVGLAKSNVLRYFESREAILLDLLSLRADSLLERIAEQLPGITGPVRSRVAGVASALAKEFAADPMLCELLSAQAGVLEHNVSAETVAQYKRDGYRILASAAATLQQVLPELGDAAAEAVRTLLVLAGALWTHAHPPQAVRDAYAADPSLVFLPEGFVRTLDRTITLVLLGILASGE